MNSAAPFTWIIPLADLAPGGREISRLLSEDERLALARHAGLEGVSALKAKGEMRPWANGAEAEIAFTADVVQTCVVTLEPVSEHIEGAFTRRYLPGIGGDEARDLELLPDEEDPPEPLEGDVVDLGPALAEELILSLDPYPRAPGATLPEEARDKGADGSPFAVLERLKPKS